MPNENRLPIRYIQPDWKLLKTNKGGGREPKIFDEDGLKSHQDALVAEINDLEKSLETEIKLPPSKSANTLICNVRD